MGKQRVFGQTTERNLASAPSMQNSRVICNDHLDGLVMGICKAYVSATRQSLVFTLVRKANSHLDE